MEYAGDHGIRLRSTVVRKVPKVMTRMVMPNRRPNAFNIAC